MEWLQIFRRMNVARIWNVSSGSNTFFPTRTPTPSLWNPHPILTRASSLEKREKSKTIHDGLPECAMNFLAFQVHAFPPLHLTRTIFGGAENLKTAAIPMKLRDPCASFFDPTDQWCYGSFLYPSWSVHAGLYVPFGLYTWTYHWIPANRCSNMNNKGCASYSVKPDLPHLFFITSGLMLI